MGTVAGARTRARAAELRAIVAPRYKAGERVADIAASLGINDITIHHWARRFRWKRKARPTRLGRPRPRPWEAQARADFEAGVLPAEMERRYGVTADWVCALARRLGWDAEARRLALRGLTPIGRICSACEIEKPADAFRHERRGPRARCRDCERPARIAHKHAARARHVHDDGTLTPAVVGRLFAEAVECVYCERIMGDGEKTLDHVQPRSRGGAHSIANVVVCCRSCNSAKHARSLGEWLDVLRRRRRARAA